MIRDDHDSLPLTFDEVARYFSVPIAEAANILGVCSSVLKKICRDNGIPRWPYRKFLAGRSVEDIKREAIKDKDSTRDKESTEDLTKPSNDNNKSLPSSGAPSLGISLTQMPESKPATLGMQIESKVDTTINDMGRWQQGVSTSGTVLQPSGTRPPQTVRQHPYHSSHRVSIQTYLDEFKQGFPRNGLSSVSSQWWSSSGSLTAQNASDDSQRNETLSVGGTSDKSEGNEAGNAVQENRKLNSESDGFLKSLSSDISKTPGPIRLHDEDLMHVTLLSRTRKKNAENGRKALKLAVTNGYGAYKLEEKDKLLLKQVFGSSFPRQWTASLS
ncbi:hypothetical protein SUGI_0284960 [Cryptomeria japonica]|nr:hypothetical protein SUGI_0284960 [Cryptomeria japonica]